MVNRTVFKPVFASCFGLLVSLNVFAAPSDEATSRESNYRWSELASMPIRVQEIYPVLHQGAIFVAGGLSPDVSDKAIDVTPRVFAYDVASNQWAETQSLPEPRHHPQLVSLGEKLYAFGGFVINQRGAWHNSPSSDVFNSSEKEGHWEPINAMPEPLSETISTVFDGNIHIATGRSPISGDTNGEWRDQTDSAAHWIYSPERDQWQKGPAAPTQRNSACGVQVNDKWHIIGGRTVANGNVDTHEVYDFVSQQWTTKAPLPDKQGGLACAAIDNAIYVFGGEYFNDGGGVYDAVWRYDTNADSWQQVSQMPVARHGLGAVAIGDQIVVIAGAAQAGGNQTSNRVSVFKTR